MSNKQNAKTDPLLLDLPEHILTARLLLRAAHPGDGPAVNAAVTESLESLQRWMPWANPAPTVEQSEIWCRHACAQVAARQGWHLLLHRVEDGALLGTVGAHHVNWSVPRIEVGYWLRESARGHGYMSEAVEAFTQFCMEKLGVRRVELRIDELNRPSCELAERVGFALEGVLRNDVRSTAGKLASMRVYARVRDD